MSEHIVRDIGNGRWDIECQNCNQGMEVSSSPLAQAMLANWPKFHKCPKTAKSKR